MLVTYASALENLVKNQKLTISFDKVVELVREFEESQLHPSEIFIYYNENRDVRFWTRGKDCDHQYARVRLMPLVTPEMAKAAIERVEKEWDLSFANDWQYDDETFEIQAHIGKVFFTMRFYLNGELAGYKSQVRL
jgi:hypothetical protein